MVPYVEGYSQLPDTDFSELEARLGMTSGEYYEATQRQRRYEAAIRRTKREIAVGEAAGVDMTDRRVLLGRQQDRVRQWCRDNGLTRDYGRERAYGVGSQPRALGTGATTRHARERMSERGVTERQVDDALRSPIHSEPTRTDEEGRRSRKVIGLEATVVYNPDTGDVVTAYPTSERRRRRYGAQ